MNSIHTSAKCPLPGRTQVIACSVPQGVGPNLAHFLHYSYNAEPLHEEHPQRCRVRWIWPTPKAAPACHMSLTEQPNQAPGSEIHCVILAQHMGWYH